MYGDVNILGENAFANMYVYHNVIAVIIYVYNVSCNSLTFHHLHFAYYP